MAELLEEQNLLSGINVKCKKCGEVCKQFEQVKIIRCYKDIEEEEKYGKKIQRFMDRVGTGKAVDATNCRPYKNRENATMQNAYQMDWQRA